MDLITRLDDERLEPPGPVMSLAYCGTYRDSLRAALSRAEEAERHAKRLDEYMLKGVAFRDELQAQLCRARTRLDHMYHVCNMSPQEIAEAGNDIFGASPCPHEARVKELEEALKMKWNL